MRPTSIAPTNVPAHYITETLPPIGQLLAASADPVAAIRAVDYITARKVPQDDYLRALSDDAIRHQITADTSRIPLDPDREFYGGEDHVGYWATGLGDALLLNDLMRRYLDREADAPVTTLDLGCSSGRLLRHQHILRPSSRTMGSDINPNSIAFCRSYLPPAIIAFHNVVFPPLPLANASVDFLAALSVFTHIDEFEDAWLLEIARVLKPGGIAFVTVHTERAFAEPDAEHFPFRQFVSSRPHSVSGSGLFFPEVTDAVFNPKMLTDRLVFTPTDGHAKNAQVFHRLDYIKSRWDQFLSIVDIIPHTHGVHQDGVVLRK